MMFNVIRTLGGGYELCRPLNPRSREPWVITDCATGREYTTRADGAEYHRVLRLYLQARVERRLRRQANADTRSTTS